MIFRPLELSFSLKEQIGLVFCSFSWDDGTYNSLLGCIYDREYNYLYLSLGFFGFVIYKQGGENEMD